jgi:hypothetical protein
MQSGELVIIGQNQVNIYLKDMPAKVTCKFKHEGYEMVPCNPCNADCLEFEVCYQRGSFVLKIKWKVSSVRDIIWAAYY